MFWIPKTWLTQKLEHIYLQLQKGEITVNPFHWHFKGRHAVKQEATETKQRLTRNTHLSPYQRGRGCMLFHSSVMLPLVATSQNMTLNQRKATVWKSTIWHYGHILSVVMGPIHHWDTDCRVIQTQNFDYYFNHFFFPRGWNRTEPWHPEAEQTFSVYLAWLS